MKAEDYERIRQRWPGFGLRAYSSLSLGAKSVLGLWKPGEFVIELSRRKLAGREPHRFQSIRVDFDQNTSVWDF